jgi:hypothetical protein
LEAGSIETRQIIRKGTALYRKKPCFSGVFRGFRAELANLARFGSPYLNVAT